MLPALLHRRRPAPSAPGQTASCLSWASQQCGPRCPLLHHLVRNGILGPGMCSNQRASACAPRGLYKAGEPRATRPAQEPGAALPSPAQAPAVVLGQAHSAVSRATTAPASREPTQAVPQVRSWARAVRTTGSQGAAGQGQGDRYLVLQPRDGAQGPPGLGPGLPSVLVQPCPTCWGLKLQLGLGPNVRCGVSQASSRF